MPQTPISVTFKEAVKHPLTYALILVVSIAWFFVYSFTGIVGKSSESCELEKQELRKQVLQAQVDLREERQAKDFLIKSILVKEGVIDNLKTVTDSLRTVTDSVKNKK